MGTPAGYFPVRFLTFASYINTYADDHTDGLLTDRALECIEKYHPDLVFLYMVETDEKGGHDSDWMTPTYLQYISHAIENVKNIWETYGDEYTILVTADHGGHDRGHGSDMPEDMTIPQFYLGREFEAGKAIPNVSLLDLAPTAADLLQVAIPQEWEGKSLLRK